MKSFLPFFCLLAIISVYSVGASFPKRGRSSTAPTTSSTTPSPDTESSSSVAPSVETGRSTTWKPSGKPPRRFTTTTTRAPGHPNNDLIRKGLIEKLCSKKNGGNASTTTTVKPDSDTSSSSPASKSSTTTRRPRSQLFARSRPSRAAQAEVPTTAGPTCSEFDNLSFEELTNRVKAGLKPVGRRMRA